MDSDRRKTQLYRIGDQGEGQDMAKPDAVLIYPGTLRSGARDPGHPLRQPPGRQHPPRRILQAHVVMVLSPVVPDEQQHPAPFRTYPLPVTSSPRENHQRPNGYSAHGSIAAGHATPSAVYSPGHRRGHGLTQELEVRGKFGCSPASGYRSQVSRTGLTSRSV